MYRGTFAVVDKRAIARNVMAVKGALHPNTRLLVTVKANGYGHGALQAADAAVRGGATDLGVASVEEGIYLRQNGVETPILVMGAVSSSAARAAASAGLRVGLASGWDNLPDGTFTPPLEVHLKVDTGMGRLGVRNSEEAIRVLRELNRRKDIDVTGIFTHLACADASQLAHAEGQIRRFTEILNALQTEGLKPPLIHASNSAGALRMTDWQYDMVRVGIAAYGYAPSDEFTIPISLTPALNLYSFVTRVDTLAPGETVGYGATFTAHRPTRVATVPVGYADGYFRILSNRASVIVHGQEAPVIGNVCMDQLMIDVTDIEVPLATRGVERGDCVTLYGHHAPVEWNLAKLDMMTEVEQIRWIVDSFAAHAPVANVLSLDVLAKLASTISYELMCALAARVPRIYVENGREL